MRGAHYKLRVAAALMVGALALTAVSAGAPERSSRRALPKRDNTPIKPMIPQANRYQAGKVFLERADLLSATTEFDYQILTGNVEFRKADMYMYCDSAHFYDHTGSLEAFGNVRMQQGDTLFVYADMLNYDGPAQLAVLYADPGRKVRLINRDVKLETDVFNYDLAIDLGYYNVGGVLTDKQNRLESIEGEYSPASKEANFYGRVHLNSRSQRDTLDIFTDTLYYNTLTHIAEIDAPAKIVNSEAVIYTSNGMYNTNTNVADLYDRSLVVTKTNKTLEGDTLFYDRASGYGEAIGNMVLTDTANHSILMGDYGFYNELTDSAFVTGHALGMEYSEGDTLYIHGDTIRAFRRITPNVVDTLLSDTTRYVVACPRVRFYRSDIQGLCDSLTGVDRDSMLYLDKHPIVWSGSRQILGGTIALHLNDSTVDWALLPNTGFMSELIEEPFYNQLSGKEMKAWFENRDLKRLDVSGNVQAVFLPQENDSTYNKIVNVESSFLSADFANSELQRMKLWPETSGTTTPLYLAKKSLYYLPRFKWWEHLRPMSPDDVFVYPEGMDELLSDESTNIH